MTRFLRYAAFSILIGGVSARSVYAAPRDFAIGLSIGSPMGLSIMQNIGETEAVQVAFEANVYNPWVLQGDYLFKVRWPQPFPEERGKAYIYYGPGVRFEYGGREQSVAGPYRTSDEGRLALRLAGGVQYYIPKLPFDVFVETAPLLSLWESTTVDLVTALGIRFNL